MSDKERVIKYILQFSPAVIDETKKEFQRYVKDDNWNRSIMGLAGLKDLIALQKHCFEQWEKLNPQKDIADPNEGERAPKIDIEVQATGKLTFSIKCFSDEFVVSTNGINEYSMIVCWQKVYDTLSAAITEEESRLEKKLPLTDGMTKTQFQKHIDAKNLIHKYLIDQMMTVREKMVKAKKAKMAGKSTAKKKSGIVIAPANVKLPSTRK